MVIWRLLKSDGSEIATVFCLSVISHLSPLIYFTNN
jgi:hypothetical protein